MADAGEAAARTRIEEARGWIGHRLDELGGAEVGSVEAVFVDEPGGEPEWLLVKLGRRRQALVPARDAVAGVGQVWVPYGRDQVHGGPAIEPGAPLTAAGERELLEHYGIAVDAGRAAELGKRDDESVSARPD